MKDGNREKRSGGRSRRLKVIVAVLLIYLVIIIAVATVIDARHVRFYMSGSDNVTQEYGTTFKDPGIYAVSTGKLFGEGNRQLEIKTEGTVNTEALGSYTIKYGVRYLFRDYSTERHVNVVDTQPPVIELKHKEGYEASWMTGYVEEGYTASDNCDGDLTAKVIRAENEDKIIYTVTDSSGNTATAEREIQYIKTEPRIVLYGDENMVVTASAGFTDPGYSATDGAGDDLTQLVQVDSNVVAYLAGDYRIVYTITNELGNSVSAVRNVTVIPANRPDVVTPDTKTIYLTFDDGPGPYTGKLLDVLAKYNVKATFFVTAANPKYYDMIAREVNEGHSVGVHTYSHNYKSIYSSEEAFFEDFYAMQDVIYEQTGCYTNLYRFPGGSSNTVSSFNPGIMSRLTKALTDMGYKYFDWNVSSGDAGETTRTNVVVDNIEAGCRGMKASVVLQHDIKDFSVNAVESVIIWGLQNGYTFRALDMTSPDAHHGVNN
ncbi:MAG: polysaccharide deacetylase [Clostridiales bacterium]|nr:polysaccharide deacetylase [Clostridiales bacterium]